MISARRPFASFSANSFPETGGFLGIFNAYLHYQLSINQQQIDNKPLELKSQVINLKEIDNKMIVVKT